MRHLNGTTWGLLLSVVISGCNQSQLPETLVVEPYDVEAMDQAIATARSKVDFFIEQFEQGNGTDFAVKVPIVDGDETENFWLVGLTYADGTFSGRIGNDPGVVTNVTYDQPWSIAKDEIADWLFFRDDKMHGNYTLRPLLETMPPEQAEEIRKTFAHP